MATILGYICRCRDKKNYYYVCVKCLKLDLISLITVAYTTVVGGSFQKHISFVGGLVINGVGS